MEFSTLEQKELIKYVESLKADRASLFADNVVKLGDTWYQLCKHDDIIWVIPTPIDKPIKIIFPNDPKLVDLGDYEIGMVVEDDRKI